MGAHTTLTDNSRLGSRIGTALTWLGGGQADGTEAAPDRAAYQVAGLLVLMNALLTWFATTATLAAATALPVVAILPFTFLLGLIVGAVSRALASGNRASRRGIAGRALVILFIGIVIGELAAITVFSGSIDRSLDDQARQAAAASPAVVAADRELGQLRDNRTGLDNAVREARGHVDESLVTARCEFNPSPACPPQKITGVPGTGPETRTANERLAGAQRELETASATRDDVAPGLDTDITKAEAGLQAARTSAPVNIDRSLGARWTAMNDYTVAHFGAMLFRLLTIAFFVLLTALPLVLRLWRGETELDRSEQARATQRRAEQDAETTIAVKRAEVRAAAETLWAEQQLAKARLSVEAQTVIDRESQRRRVLESSGVQELSAAQPMVEEPRVTEFSWSTSQSAANEPTPLAELTAAEMEARVMAKPRETQNLPATVGSAPVEQHKSGPFGLIPINLPFGNAIDDVTNVIGGLMKPFVPPVIAKAFGTRSVKSDKRVVEEFEEVKFSFTRSRKVSQDQQETVETVHQPQQQQYAHDPHAIDELSAPRRVATTRVQDRYVPIDAGWDIDELPTRNNGEIEQRRGRHSLPPGN